MSDEPNPAPAGNSASAEPASPPAPGPSPALATAPAPGARPERMYEDAVGSRLDRWNADLRARGRYTELAALLAFLVPGLGHVYLGRHGKGVIAFLVLVGLFGWGVGISRGECVSLAGDEESGHRYAFIAQVGAGLPTALALLHTHAYEVEHALGMKAEKPPEVSSLFETPEYVERLPRQDEGLLYTMIAGLLNLLLIYDAFLGSPGSALRPGEEPERATVTATVLPSATGPPPGPPPAPPAAEVSP